MNEIRGPHPSFAADISHLPHPGLQRLLGYVLLDPDFGARFLNGGRVEILSEADFLSVQERALLSSIQADTPHELANAMLYYSQSSFHGDHNPT